ncbi:MAG: hypothetical protein MJ000_02475 [Bacteroidales bacterium]|nr:hypothetical protein [Bacteroidales bacterium]
MEGGQEESPIAALEQNRITPIAGSWGDRLGVEDYCAGRCRGELRLKNRPAEYHNMTRDGQTPSLVVFRRSVTSSRRRSIEHAKHLQERM